MRLQTQTAAWQHRQRHPRQFRARPSSSVYDPRVGAALPIRSVRLLSLAIAGGLYVLIYEIVTFDTVSAAKSANALLAVYIGGAGGFFGPILGTIVVVLLQSGGQPAQQCLAASMSACSSS